MPRTLVKRSDKVAFFGNVSSGTETFNRMRGFTTLSQSKNPKEYSRQYVDEEFETTDVTGYSPSYDFGFDQYKDDPVHDEMVEILDDEKTGTVKLVEIWLLLISHNQLQDKTTLIKQ